MTLKDSNSASQGQFLFLCPENGAICAFAVGTHLKLTVFLDLEYWKKVAGTLSTSKRQVDAQIRTSTLEATKSERSFCASFRLQALDLLENRVVFMKGLFGGLGDRDNPFFIIGHCHTLGSLDLRGIEVR